MKAIRRATSRAFIAGGALTVAAIAVVAALALRRQA
jgi:hypothetical protein